MHVACDLATIANAPSGSTEAQRAEFADLTKRVPELLAELHRRMSEYSGHLWRDCPPDEQERLAAEVVLKALDDLDSFRGHRPESEQLREVVAHIAQGGASNEERMSGFKLSEYLSFEEEMWQSQLRIATSCVLGGRQQGSITPAVVDAATAYFHLGLDGDGLDLITGFVDKLAVEQPLDLEAAKSGPRSRLSGLAERVAARH